MSASREGRRMRRPVNGFMPLGRRSRQRAGLTPPLRKNLDIAPLSGGFENTERTWKKHENCQKDKRGMQARWKACIP